MKRPGDGVELLEECAGHRSPRRQPRLELQSRRQQEITLEANPGTIERGAFAEYRAAGVTRVSLGAQSFDAGILKTLGRIHSPSETRRAAEELHAAGLANFNLDLMYALPRQDVAGALRDMVQNHLLQLLCLVAMEPPTGNHHDSIRDKKLDEAGKVLDRVRADLLPVTRFVTKVAEDDDHRAGPAWLDHVQHRWNPCLSFDRRGLRR